MVQERQQAEGDALREKRLIKDLEDKRREQIGRRAVNTMFRRRLARAFYALAEGVDARRARRERIRRVMVHIAKGGMARAFEAWRQATAELRLKKDAARCAWMDFLWLDRICMFCSATLWSQVCPFIQNRVRRKRWSQAQPSLLRSSCNPLGSTHR